MLYTLADRTVRRLKLCLKRNLTCMKLRGCAARLNRLIVLFQL
jgi:hypothetical protein